MYSIPLRREGKTIEEMDLQKGNELASQDLLTKGNFMPR